MELIVSAHGGLGNQLFQYAALLYYSQRLQAGTRALVQPRRSANSYGFPRPFLLSHFSVETNMRELSPIDFLLIRRNPWLEAALAPIKRSLRTEVFREDFDSRYLFAPDIPAMYRTRKLYLVGYWQNYVMVDAVERELRSELTLTNLPQGKNLETLKQIQQSKNTVSIHIRRGDSALAATNRAILPAEYYLKNIYECEERLEHPTFYVFSDDISFAKEYIPRTVNAVYVEHNDDFSAHEDLRLMASCRHHIIANSTFSWWGAWLSPFPDKMVFAPKHWYRTEDSYYPELLPPSWTLVDVALRA